MILGALAPYERSLSNGTALQLQHLDGRSMTLDVSRWLGPADAVDLDIVRRSVAPVLDVGCGPGRIVAALTSHGRLALGIDIAERAVALTRARGSSALRRDVFGPLPGETRWNTVLLMDGNIGIGGDLDALLTRVAALLAPGGTIVVEIDPDIDTNETGAVRFAVAGRAVGPSFPWCFVGSHAVHRAAERCRLTISEEWTAGPRRFAMLSAEQIP